jgi:outer membrane protein OmpA-like peptidoglycan-associated protein
MRRFLYALCLLIPSVATAQVATDDRALDQLPAAAKTKPAAKPAPASHPAHARHPTRPKVAQPAHPALKTVTMPALPPANPVLAPPPFVMPAHAPPPPPPVPFRADAPGAATAMPGGTRIGFGAGVSDLNSATIAAIQAIATRAIAAPAMVISITAWAPGTADDPSTPRRLSLERALAVRAVLIKAGLASDRIRTVAKGMSDSGNGPFDRADVLELPAAR